MRVRVRLRSRGRRWGWGSGRGSGRRGARSTRKMVRKRAVSREYTRGMGDLKMRSLAPVRSTRLEIDWSMRAECIGLMFALRRVADMALRQNMGRFFASMTASACSCAIKPCWTKSFSSDRSVSSSAGLV